MMSSLTNVNRNYSRTENSLKTQLDGPPHRLVGVTFQRKFSEMMKNIILIAIFLASCLKECTCYDPRLRIFKCNTLNIGSRKDSQYSVSSRDMITRVNSKMNDNGGEILEEPYLQHVCPSCSYVYDESKGFKKRHPPGDENRFVVKFC
jgi:hypothetical protein